VRLPGDTPRSDRRLPTALDVAVLLQILAELQRRAGNRIVHRIVERVEFASLSAIIRRLGLESRNRERRRVRDSINYLQAVSIRFATWYEGGRRTERRLRPPITGMRLRGQRVVIQLDHDWVRLARARAYYVNVPLPLPRTAAAQNLVVHLTAWAQEDQDSHGEGIPLERDRAWLTRKLGLDHSRRNAVLESALAAAQEWFERTGGELCVIRSRREGDVLEDGKIGFVAHRVRVPRGGPRSKPKRGREVSPRGAKRSREVNPKYEFPYGNKRNEGINGPAVAGDRLFETTSEGDEGDDGSSLTRTRARPHEPDEKKFEDEEVILATECFRSERARAEIERVLAILRGEAEV
jgi:hypothetical protein